MKEVQLTEQDRAIIRACTNAGAIDKLNFETLKSLLKGEETLKLDDIKGADLKKMGDLANTYQLEDAHYDALSTCIDTGRPQLLKAIKGEYVRCYEHFHASKEADEPAKE